MFTYSAIALLAVLGQAVNGSPIEKRFTNSVIRSGRNGQCLSLPAGVAPSNGAGLVTRDCAGASRWDINPGSGSVILSGTNFALDAGVPQGNNMYAKVWQSYPGSTQQTWYLTADNRIAVTGGNQCLDQGDNGPQTYQCISGNTNQVWYVGGSTPPPSSSVSSSASRSSAPPSSSSSPPPQATGRQLKFGGNRNLCATVQSGSGGDGVLVNVEGCNAASTAQRWNFMGNGLIQYAGTNYCLDAGSNPANGVQMKLWTCYSGLAQQTWGFPNGSGLYRTSNNQCLDVDNGNFFKLQTWTCSGSDAQQQFSMV